jgi:hypothetical protein
VGRKEIPINWERVDELMMCGCPGTEIAAYFGMHEDTFYKRVEAKYSMGFSAYLAKNKATGEALIREAQFKKALGHTKKGDNTLLIWLGKQRLGQKEQADAPQATQEILKNYETMIEQIRALQQPKEKPQEVVASD